MTTSNIRRDTTPSPPSATSQHTSGKGDVLQLQMSDSSDDDIPLLSFKLSALTNALLNSENQQQDVYPRRYQGRQNQPSTTRTSYDNVERQPKSDSSRLYRQSQSSSATGCGLPESDNTRPMRIVRLRSKDPRAHGTNTPRELQCSPQSSGISAERSQLDGGMSGKLVTPSPDSTARSSTQQSRRVLPLDLRDQARLVRAHEAV